MTIISRINSFFVQVSLENAVLNKALGLIEPLVSLTYFFMYSMG